MGVTSGLELSHETIRDELKVDFTGNVIRKLTMSVNVSKVALSPITWTAARAVSSV